MPVRLLLCVMVCVALGACTASVPGRIKRQLAPPDGTVPDHFRLRTEAAAAPVVPAAGPTQDAAP